MLHTARAAAAAADEGAAGEAAEPGDASDMYETATLGPAAMEAALARAAEEQQAWPFMTCGPDLSQPLPAVMEAEPLRARDAGALWHIFRREDTEALSRWLMARVDQEAAATSEAAKRALLAHPPVCARNQIDHAVHSQAFFITAGELAVLAAETGVHSWAFRQFDGEAVFIPAGCPHQVRNTNSCTKLALDFVSPESLRECAALAREFAAIGVEEKLQSQTMLLYGAQWAARVVGAAAAEGAEGGAAAIEE